MSDKKRPTIHEIRESDARGAREWDAACPPIAPPANPAFLDRIGDFDLPINREPLLPKSAYNHLTHRGRARRS
jgi:hypothetical protein